MRAFVIAMESEAEVVRRHLNADDRLFVSGIGKVNAAAATQRAIDAGATEVWNVGVAGGLGVEILGVYEIGRAVEYDFDLSEVNGTSVGVHDERVTPYFVLQPKGLFPAKTLGSGDHFTESEAETALLRRLGVEIRDMEGAAIAHVCEANKIPFTAIKAITDLIGAGAVSDFRRNLPLALARLDAALGKIVS